jgi:LemA protein
MSMIQLRAPVIALLAALFAIPSVDYIEAVRAYNTEIRTFPSIIWAKTVFGSKPMAEFAANETAQTPPQVKF